MIFFVYFFNPKLVEKEVVKLIIFVNPPFNKKWNF